MSKLKIVGTGIRIFSTPPVPTPVTTPWVRDPSWPACEADAGDNKIVGLYAIWPVDSGNFFAITINGAYTVDFGDGTTSDFGSAVQANYEYDYNNAALDNTDAPVTFTAATSTVNRTAHGYSNGMLVRFYNILTTTGLDQGQQYYVINATTDTFQVSSTEGGTAVALTNDGSAKLLPYKIAIVTITPQVGNDLNIVNFFVKHNQSNLATGYSTGWLDLAIAAPNCSGLTIGSSLTTVRHGYIERVRLNQLGSITSFASLFWNLRSLRNVHIADTITSVTNMNGTFNSCYALASIPLFDTSGVSDMTSTFSGCLSLASVPLFNTSSCTTMNSMFNSCFSLVSVPLFDTSSVTNMQSMLTGCYSLVSVPLFDTSSVTNMQSMFSSCYSLVSVPLFNTSSVTNMTSMFSNCYSLGSVPQFNTAIVTSMSGMFSSCTSLTSVPLFNTAMVTTTSDMFNSCYSLVSVPLLDTSSVTNMASMFTSCYSLVSVPQFNTSSVTNMQGMFNNCRALVSVPMLDTALVITMASMFNSCFSLVSVPLFNTSSLTSMTSMFNSCYSLVSVPLFNTTSVTGMNSLFSNCNSLTAVPALVTTAVTSSSNFSSMFNACNSLNRMEAKNFRFTFSLLNCKLSASALNEIYTNLPTVTGQTITVTGNYGTASDDPTIATAKGWTVTG